MSLDLTPAEPVPLGPGPQLLPAFPSPLYCSSPTLAIPRLEGIKGSRGEEVSPIRGTTAEEEEFFELVGRKLVFGEHDRAYDRTISNKIGVGLLTFILDMERSEHSTTADQVEREEDEEEESVSLEPSYEEAVGAAPTSYTTRMIDATTASLKTRYPNLFQSLLSKEGELTVEDGDQMMRARYPNLFSSRTSLVTSRGAAASVTSSPTTSSSNTSTVREDVCSSLRDIYPGFFGTPHRTPPSHGTTPSRQAPPLRGCMKRRKLDFDPEHSVPNSDIGDASSHPTKRVCLEERPTQPRRRLLSTLVSSLRRKHRCKGASPFPSNANVISCQMKGRA